MNNSEKKITLECIQSENNISQYSNKTASNPINIKMSTDKKLELMIKNILDTEIPRLKNYPLLHDLILYTVTEKLTTVQSVKNVLSYIKENKVKKVNDICFKNGEIRIKCST